MSDDSNISCGPFWLLEQILRLTAERNGCFFERVIATGGWYRAHVGKPKLPTALHFLKQLSTYEACKSMDKLNVKLFFYTYPDKEDEPHGDEWFIQEALMSLRDSLGVALYDKSNKTAKTRDSDLLVHYNETAYHLPLGQAVQYLEQLLQFDLASHNEELQIGFQFEIAPWRNTRPEEDGCCARKFINRQLTPNGVF